MYHPIAIVIAIKVLTSWRISNPFIQHLCSLIITIIIAGLSYRFYESYFINKKVKFSKIVSGDNASLNGVKTSRFSRFIVNIFIRNKEKMG